MATQPTNLPVPSESYRDLKFNSGKIDEFVTSLVNTYVDRFGHEHYTIEGLRWLAQQAIAQYGWILIDSFQVGADITLPNQALRDEATGEYYRWDGDLPKQVDAGSTPTSTGGVGVGAWIGIGDSSLRGMLASKDGYSLIGELQSVADFNGMTGVTGKKVSLKGWYAGSTIGGGEFYFDTTAAKSKHDGGVYFSPTVPYSTTLGDYVNGVGETDPAGYGVWVRSFEGEYVNTDWYGVNNGLTSHGSAFQKAFDSAMILGLNVKINSNKKSSSYYIDTALTLGPSTSGHLLTPCLYGEGKNLVKIRTSTSILGYAITINGNHPTEGRFEMSGFDIQADISSGSSPSGSGINIKNMNTFHIHDLRISVYNLCINYDNILYGQVSRVTCYRGNTGMVFQNGNPNMITLMDCEFLSMIANSLRIYKGCPFIVDTCSFEGSGAAGDVAFRAIRYTGGLDDGGHGLTVRNSYFEANSGVNIQIDHNTQRSALHTISNNTFNNTSSSKYTISDIYLLGGSVALTGANKVILECRSNTHFGAGTYTASSTRPRVSITQFSTGGNGHCEFRDFGNRYMTGENPTFDSVVYVKYSYNFSGKAYVGSDATTTSSVNVSSVTKPSTGTYVITLNHIIYGNHVTLTPMGTSLTIPRLSDVPATGSNSITVTTVNSSGTLTDAPFFIMLTETQGQDNYTSPA